MYRMFIISFSHLTDLLSMSFTPFLTCGTPLWGSLLLWGWDYSSQLLQVSLHLCVGGMGGIIIAVGVGLIRSSRGMDGHRFFLDYIKLV